MINGLLTYWTWFLAACHLQLCSVYGCNKILIFLLLVVTVASVAIACRLSYEIFNSDSIRDSFRLLGKDTLTN